MEEWLWATDKVGQVLELPCIPNHTTLQRTSSKPRNLVSGEKRRKSDPETG